MERSAPAMKVFGIAGWSGSGKTTLVCRLIPVLAARGLAVSTVKHAHHGFDIDQPGKDSYEHRRAGAREVLISSARRFALMHEHRGEPEPTLAELLGRLEPVDLLLVEGFKREAHPKLEVYRPSLGKPPLYPEDANVVALASVEAVAGAPLPVLDLDDVEAVADFVLEHCGLAAPAGAAAAARQP